MIVYYILKILSYVSAYQISWYTTTGSALGGVVSIVLMGEPFGWLFLIVGMIGLIILALVNAWQNTKADEIQPESGELTVQVGMTLFFVAFILASELIPTTIDIPFVGRLAILMTGVQALFLAISVRRSEIPFIERIGVPSVGHSFIGLGSIILIISAFIIPHERVFQGVLLWYATGLSALALDTFWMGQRLDQITPSRPNSVSRYWEQVLLGTITIGMSSLIFIVLTSVNEPLTLEIASLGQPWAIETRLQRVAATVVGGATVIGFATLAAPASTPSVIQQFDRTSITISLQAVTTILLLNAMLLGLFFLLPGSFVLVFGILLGLVTVAVLVEYVRILYAHRKQGRGPPSDTPPPTEIPPVTVVIVAYNEADILQESIERNLERLTDLPFLLVPAANSTDGTVELAYEYQASHPDKIRVIEGTTGSKAGDLNLVWGNINTPYVLLLDADETADLAFVSQAVRVLEESQEVGIVQGRKIARRPEDSWMARFVSAERRLDTWINHQYIHDKFGANHFAGSAALLRQEVPLDIDGWSTRTLTEDIDLTLRIYLQTNWDISYHPDMTISNLKPATIIDLVRQRRRWARGWIEMFWRYTGAILRSRQTLGWTRTIGLLWELFATVGAPFYLTSVSITLFVLIGLGFSLPILLALFLAAVLLPARGISFVYAALRDPEIPISKRITRVGEVILYAYLWILILWLIQLHTIYLQLAGAPKRWEVTTKGRF